MLRKYVHGPGADEPIVWYEGTGTTGKGWLYADHLGSIVAVANSAGASTATYRYGPYGEPDTVAGAMRFRYTGQQLIGELGLYHYKARVYSPALGRFLQTDPIGYADDMNLYAYVGGNPANRTDPSALAMVKTDDPNMVQTNAIVYGSATIAAAYAICQGMPTCREGLAAGMRAIGDRMFNEGGGAGLPANPQDITNPPQAPPIPGDWIISPNPRRPGGIIATPPDVSPGSSDKGSEHIRVDPPGSSPVPGLEEGYWRWNRPGVGAYNPGRGNFGGTQGQTHVPLPPGYNIPQP